MERGKGKEKVIDQSVVILDLPHGGTAGGAAGGDKSLHGRRKLKVKKPPSPDLEITHVDTSVSIPSCACPPVKSSTNSTSVSTTAITISDDEEDTRFRHNRLQASEKRKHQEYSNYASWLLRQLAGAPPIPNQSRVHDHHPVIQPSKGKLKGRKPPSAEIDGESVDGQRKLKVRKPPSAEIDGESVDGQRKLKVRKPPSAYPEITPVDNSQPLLSSTVSIPSQASVDLGQPFLSDTHNVPLPYEIPSTNIENVIVPPPPPLTQSLRPGCIVPLPQNCVPVPVGMTSGLLQNEKPEGNVTVCTQKLFVVSDTKLEQENEGGLDMHFPQNRVSVKVENTTSSTCPNVINAGNEKEDCPMPSQGVASKLQVFQPKLVLTKLHDVSPNKRVKVSSIYDKALSSVCSRSLESQTKGIEMESDTDSEVSEAESFDTNEDWAQLSPCSDSDAAADEWTDDKNCPKSKEGLIPLRNCINVPGGVKSGLLQEVKPEGDDVNVCTEKLSIDSDIKLKQENEGISCEIPVPLQICVPVKVENTTTSDDIKTGENEEDCPVPSQDKSSHSLRLFQAKVVLIKLYVSPNERVKVSSIDSKSSSTALSLSSSSQSRYGRTLKPRLVSLSTRSLKDETEGIKTESNDDSDMSENELFDTDGESPLFSPSSGSESDVASDERISQAAHKKQKIRKQSPVVGPGLHNPQYVQPASSETSYPHILSALGHSLTGTSFIPGHLNPQCIQPASSEISYGSIISALAESLVPREVHSKPDPRPDAGHSDTTPAVGSNSSGAPAPSTDPESDDTGSAAAPSKLVKRKSTKRKSTSIPRKRKPRKNSPAKLMGKMLENLLKVDSAKISVGKNVGKIDGFCSFCNKCKVFNIAVPWPKKIYMDYTCAECEIRPKYTNPEGKALSWKFVQKMNKLSSSPLIVNNSKDTEASKMSEDKKSSNESKSGTRKVGSPKKLKPLKGGKGQNPSKKMTRKRGGKKHIEVSESEQYNESEGNEVEDVSRDEKEGRDTTRESNASSSLNQPSDCNIVTLSDQSTGVKLDVEHMDDGEAGCNDSETPSDGSNVKRNQSTEVEVDNEVEKSRDDSMESNTGPAVSQTSDGHSETPSNISKPWENQMLQGDKIQEKGETPFDKFPSKVVTEQKMLANQPEKGCDVMTEGLNAIENETNGKTGYNSTTNGNNGDSESSKPDVGDRDIEDNQIEPNRMDSREYTTEEKTLDRKDLREMHSTVLDTGHDHGCSVCSMTAETFNELMEHLWFKHQVKECDPCEVDFLLPGQYSRHMRTHVVENIKFCPLCCESVKDYCLHSLHVHKNQSCPICGTPYLNTRGYMHDRSRKFNRSHIKAHKDIDASLKGNFHCHYPYCGFDSDSFDYLLKHLWYHHQDGKCPACETHPNHETFSSLLEHCHVSHQDLDTEPVKNKPIGSEHFKNSMPGRVSCDICKKDMDGLVTKLKHMWLIHDHASDHFTTGRHFALPQNVIADLVSSRIRQYQCWRCDWSDGLRNMTTLTTHMWTCHGMRHCPHCDKPYTSLQKIHKHLKDHRSQFMISPDSSTCPYLWCHQRMNSVFEMIRHLYHKHRPRLCPFCDTFCELEIQFVAHIILHWQAVYDRDIILSFLAGSRYEKSNGERKCEICPFVSWRSEVTILHLWNDHGVRFCPTCSLCALPRHRCVSLGYFMIHILKKHSLGLKATCILCGCPDIKVLIDSSHIKLVHGVRVCHRNFLYCKICPGAFHTFHTAANHECASFMGGSPCEICGKMVTQNKLSNHVFKCKKKQLTKAHLCEVCGQTFLNLGLKTSHMRIHSGEKPYKCQECGKAFARSDNLHTHMRSHSGVKPYVCEVCGKGFARGDNLKTHKRLMH